jgi:hypothetical protein
VQFQPVDETVPSDVKVRQLRDQLFARINAYNAKRSPSVRREPKHDEAGYVGSDTCAACHTGAYVWWQRTPHGRAFETLVKRGRQLDLDCIGCHVTGFDRPGGSTIANLEHLKGVGCESCHGPGSVHADNPKPGRENVQRSVPEAVCVSCHDSEHSDSFHYDRFRAALMAREHG